MSIGLIWGIFQVVVGVMILIEAYFIAKDLGTIWRLHTQ